MKVFVVYSSVIALVLLNYCMVAAQMDEVKVVDQTVDSATVKCLGELTVPISFESIVTTF